MIYESRPTEVAVYDNDHPDGPFAEAALKLKLEPDNGYISLVLQYKETRIPVSLEELEALIAAARQMIRREASP
jgi:hypothetical protein